MMTWLIDILQILYEIGALGVMFAARNEYIKLKAKETNYDTNRRTR